MSARSPRRAGRPHSSRERDSKSPPRGRRPSDGTTDVAPPPASTPSSGTRKSHQERREARQAAVLAKAERQNSETGMKPLGLGDVDLEAAKTPRKAAKALLADQPKQGAPQTEAPTHEHVAPRASQKDAGERIIMLNDFNHNLRVFKGKSNYISTTKYHWWSFLFVNLFEQFTRVANVYFLVIAVLTAIPGISPISPVTSIAPLVLVLGVTMIKDGVEDLARYKADIKTNNTPTHVLRTDKLTQNSEFVTIPWERVRVGDSILIKSDEPLPADTLVFATSQDDGLCFIETSNLDGETNLKVKQALPETATLVSEPEHVGAIKGRIVSELPNASLYTYSGALELTACFGTKGNQGVPPNPEEKVPVTPKQILLRGSTLRNTEWIVGIVVFTGVETKLMQNQREPPFKRSNIEVMMNYCIIGIFVLLAAVCAMSAALSVSYAGQLYPSYWYLIPVQSSGFLTGLAAFATFLILYNIMVPISLYVSLEMCKVFQSKFIEFDVRMYYDVTNTPAIARTSALNEELGQVEYIFSDKTGTLTRNIMEFKKLTVNGVVYGDYDKKKHDEAKLEPTSTCGLTLPKAPASWDWRDPTLFRDLQAGPNAENLNLALTLLSVSHTVIPEFDKNDSRNLDLMTYQAASPDEDALVSAARYFGFMFVGRTPNSVTVHIRGKPKTFELLNVLEFNSTRKRASVIVRSPDDKRTLLLCKGADSIIYERLNAQANHKEITRNHLQQFAAIGLRTLCLAYREISASEYSSWQREYMEAATSTTDREDKVAAVAEKIEVNMHLIGATAIEDKLQEGVPETIFQLGAAGIKLWVLTGDKQETAINIGFSARVLNSNMELMLLGGECDFVPTLHKFLEEKNPHDDVLRDNLALVIDGEKLTVALQDEHKLNFLRLAVVCKAVICCRVSPKQKSEVTLLVRDNLAKLYGVHPITLAIGDGANDVAMIQSAHIGIGISGQEGMQAVQASDYAIAQFRFLQRLCLVHGHWNYRRVAILVMYFFYKNLTMAFALMWFNIYSGWSGQTFYDDITSPLFNICFTSWPIIILGTFDQDVSGDALESYGVLYGLGQKKILFNGKNFSFWALEALYHSIIVFFFPVAAYGGTAVFTDGRNVDLWLVSMVSYTLLVFVVTYRLCLEIDRWNWLNHFCNWGSLIFYVIFILTYTSSAGFLLNAYYVYGVGMRMFLDGRFWLLMLLVPAFALLPRVLLRYVQRQSYPTPVDIVQEIEGYHIELPKHRSKMKDALRLWNDALALNMTRLNKHTGFAFSQDPGQADLVHKHGGAAYRNQLHRDFQTESVDPAIEAEQAPAPPPKQSARERNRSRKANRRGEA